jgi:hypothetical protein
MNLLTRQLKRVHSLGLFVTKLQLGNQKGGINLAMKRHSLHSNSYLNLGNAAINLRNLYM